MPQTPFHNCPRHAKNPMSYTSRLCLVLLAALWCAPLSAQEDLTEAARADSIRKYKFLGKTARDKEDMDAALGYYRELVKYDPAYRRGHFYIGQILAGMGQDEEAKGAFLQASALDSLHRNTHLGLYQVYMNASQPDSAWWALERVVRKPKYAKAYRSLRREIGDLYRRQGKAEQAIFHYVALEEGVQNPGPEDIELMELIVSLDRELGLVEDALAWQQRLTKLSGDEGGDVSSQVQNLSATVDLLEESGDVPAAIAKLRELAQLDERGRYSHYHRMHQLAEDHGRERALMEALQGMVSANPRDVETLATLIETYLGDEDKTRAGRWIDWGLKNNSDDPQLHLLQGDLLVMRGDEEGALAAFEVARTDPGWETVAQQRIWQIRPPETEEERLKREFFGGGDAADDE